MGITLGLDLGANSIGWALWDGLNSRIVASGVRVFPEGVDKFDTKKETSKTESRRVARGMRRQIARRSRRKRQLRIALVGAGLLPANREEQQKLDALDPYALRQRGIKEKLTPHEFGRVLIHLNQRRGFKSNRKSDRGRKSDEKGMLGEINQLANEIETGGSKTLGEHLAKMRSDPHHRIRARHTRREMFEQEFELLWEEQRKHHPDLLTDRLKYGEFGTKLPNPFKPERMLGKKRTLAGEYGIYGIIFAQRAMYWPKSVIGRCELEPKQARCPRADRLAQRFRLLQEVNNLRYYDPALREELPLAMEQRAQLLDKLSKVKELSFEDIRKLLGFLESVTFNLERGERKKLKGMPTDHALANKKLFGTAWHEFPEERKNDIVRAMIDLDDDALRRKAVEEWGLTPEAASEVLSVDLQEGYANLSRVALRKLLPPMERGLLYMTDDATPCALTEAGYLRPDQRPRQVLAALPEPPDVANPVVRQALHEVRKVVNAIIREFGKPDGIHVELARNAAMSMEDRQKASRKRQDNEDRRDAAADEIRKTDVKVSRDAIERYLLWKEQGGDCIYSGKPISLTQLLRGEADVDHILPYSRCLDDSMQNKAVAFRAMNHEKGNRTPREWLESDPERYEHVLQRAGDLPYNKRKKFTQKELDLDDFVERQLNDTRYLSRVIRDYVCCLVDQPHFVLCPKGTHTAELRRHWGLDTVLESLPDSPAWQTKNDLRPGEKNRADHRHHAIDAIVLALTDQKRLQQLSRIRREGGTQTTGEILPDPCERFRDHVIDVVKGINVSHRVQRRVAGAPDEDTHYGPIYQRSIKGEVTAKPGEFVVRKPVESLTASMIEEIRDATIREIVIARLKERGVEFGRAVSGSIPKETWTPQLCMESGMPIKKVRIIKRDETISPIRDGTVFVKPGSTHHLCIFEWTEKGKRKRDAVFVTMLEATTRIKNGDAVIQRVHPKKPDAQFIMSLGANEIVLMNHQGVDRLYRFETAAQTSKQMWLRETTFAGRSSVKLGQISKQPMTFNGRKVTVDPLGRVRWAND